MRRSGIGRVVAGPLGALLPLLAVLATAIPAGAHAELDTAEPVPGEVTTELDELVLFFFGGVSQVTAVLTDPSGATVALGPAELRGPSEARIPVTGEDLPAGEYRVDWSVVSADEGFTQNGAFSFTYEPPGSSPWRTVLVVAVPLVAVAGVLWWLRKPSAKSSTTSAKR